MSCAREAEWLQCVGEGGTEPEALPGSVTRRTHRETAAGAHKQPARRPDALADLADERDANGGDSLPFQHLRDQTDRLVADESSRGEDDGVAGILTEARGDCARGRAHERVGLEDVAHKAKVARCHLPDEALGGQLFQSVKRKHNVQVPSNTSPVVLHVRQTETCAGRRAREFAETPVAEQILHIEGRLVVEM